jgi:hypothetical protein
VITSRRADYEALAEPLRLQGAILVRPLTDEQVNSYLTELGPGGEPVRAALREDSSLWELLDSPLLLNIITLAYAGQAATPPQMNGAKVERRDHLFGLYVNQMLRRRAAEHRYTPEQTVQWLSWLAGQMARHGETVFYLERLQTDWLPQQQERTIRVGYGLVVRLLAGLVFVLVYGLGVGLIVGLAAGMAGGLVQGLFSGPVGVLANPEDDRPLPRTDPLGKGLMADRMDCSDIGQRQGV